MKHKLLDMLDFVEWACIGETPDNEIVEYYNQVTIYKEPLTLKDYVNEDDCLAYRDDLVSWHWQFLSQKPELWMFVPCDEEGNVMEEPFQYNIWASDMPEDVGSSEWREKCRVYAKAKERCLFEGFFIEKHYGEDWLMQKRRNDGPSLFVAGISKGEVSVLNHKTVEDIIKATK